MGGWHKLGIEREGQGADGEWGSHTSQRIEFRYGHAPELQLHDISTSEVPRVMIEAKANLEAQENTGFTALMILCMNGHEQCARELLKAGAHKDIKNKAGDTVLSLVQKGMAGAHMGICCDRSGMFPIVGNRYTLNGEDLCESEFQKLTPQEQSQWECIPPLTPSANLRAVAALLAD